MEGERDRMLTLSQDEVSLIRPLMPFRPSVVAQLAAAPAAAVRMVRVMGSIRFWTWLDSCFSTCSSGAAVAARTKVAVAKKRILKLVNRYEVG